MKNKKFELDLLDKKIKAEFKELAEQANANVLISCGGTLVLTTCVMGKEREGLGFFPLTVDYEEKYYAAGKIKGARYIRREGRPSDEAVCNARLIDRAIRPRFPKNLLREIQVVSTVFSWDGEHDPDVLGLLASSIVLSVSDIPWSGPIAALRVGRVNGKFVVNPTYEQREQSVLDVIFAAIVEDGDLLINMIEGGFEETEEALIMEALSFAEEFLRKIIDFQKEIIAQVGKEKTVVPASAHDKGLEQEIKKFLGDNLEKALFEKDKTKRTGTLQNLKDQLICFAEEHYNNPASVRYAGDFFEQEVDGLIHKNVLENKKRVDGRKMDEVRNISCEIEILPRTHGSGLFSRGQTRSLSILTLGAPGDQQLIEGMEIVGKKRFMHHYNFPPYSVGEARPLRGPGRREIGHGMLAEKALLPMIPKFEEFPYTIRIVSEMLSSNGSTSMASV